MNSHTKEQISILVENQKLFNTALPVKEYKEDTVFYGISAETFAEKFSLPLTKLVFANFIGFDLVDVKAIPHSGPNTSARTPLGGLVLTKKLRTKFSEDIDINLLAQEIIREINGEIVNDIYRNCGHDIHGPDQEDLVKEAVDKIGGEWIMVPGNSYLPTKVSDNRWEWMGCHTPMVGKKMGYSYFPYIPFALFPSFSTGESSYAGGIITRYGKYLNDSKCFVKCFKV